MNRNRRLSRPTRVCLVLTAIAGSSTAARAQFVTTPNNMNDIAGNGGLSVLTTFGPTTWQGVIAQSEFGNVKAGDRITGIQWRAMSNSFHVPSWPPQSWIDWFNFDIYLSSAATSPATMSNTFALNDGSDVTLVRSGPYTLNPHSYTNNGVSGTIRPWGPLIAFDVPFEFRGGDIAITVRQSGYFSPFNSFAFDSVFPAGDPPPPEYGTLVAGRTASGYAAPTGGGPGFVVTRFRFEPIPEPATLTLLSLAALGAIRPNDRRTRP